MSKSLISTLNTSNIRSCLGFGKNRECYYRDGELIFLDIGKLLVALVDIPIETLFIEFMKIYDEWHSCFEHTNGHNKEFLCGKFEEFYRMLYNLLCSQHILLGDQLVFPFLSEGIEEALREVPVASAKIGRTAKETLFADNDKYANFNCAKIPLFWEYIASSASCEQGFMVYINWVLDWLQAFLTKLHMLNKSISSLIPQLLVGNDSPAYNFSAWENQQTYVKGYVTHQYAQMLQSKNYTDDEIAFEAMRFFCSELFTLCKQFSGVLKAYPAEHDANCGCRWFTFYDGSYISKIAYHEFEFMSTNCIHLTTCKNCGKYFWAPSKAVRFCDREIANRPGETCRSTSAEWYAINRSVNSPGYDEYILYKKRYRMRMVRNEEKNPHDRFRRWDHKARDVVFRYELNEISLDELKNLLLEMDDDMKPLDKIQTDSGSATVRPR